MKHSRLLSLVRRRYCNTTDVLGPVIGVNHAVIESCTELMMSLNVTISSCKFKFFYLEIIAKPWHSIIYIKCCSDKRA